MWIIKELVFIFKNILAIFIFILVQVDKWEKTFNF